VPCGEKYRTCYKQHLRCALIYQRVNAYEVKQFICILRRLVFQSLQIPPCSRLGKTSRTCSFFMQILITKNYQSSKACQITSQVSQQAVCRKDTGLLPGKVDFDPLRRGTPPREVQESQIAEFHFHHSSFTVLFHVNQHHAYPQKMLGSMETAYFSSIKSGFLIYAWLLRV